MGYDSPSILYDYFKKELGMEVRRVMVRVALLGSLACCWDRWWPVQLLSPRMGRLNQEGNDSDQLIWDSL